MDAGVVGVRLSYVLALFVMWLLILILGLCRLVWLWFVCCLFDLLICLCCGFIAGVCVLLALVAGCLVLWC